MSIISMSIEYHRMAANSCVQNPPTLDNKVDDNARIIAVPPPLPPHHHTTHTYSK